MSIKRREFLSQATFGLGGSFLLQVDRLVSPLDFSIPKDFDIQYFATDWGFQGNIEAFAKASKEEGYDGVEVWFPGEKKIQDYLDIFAKYELKHAFLAGAWETDFEKHIEQYSINLEGALEHDPGFVNCHAGKDYFTKEQNSQIAKFAIEASEKAGIPVYQETHRGRMFFAAHLTKLYLEEIESLRLTLDISHWCAVHESLLEDQQEAVSKALLHTDHIHARVGHQEGPQITDPRAPEWYAAVAAHFNWWDKVVEMKVKKGEPLTVTPEFGPPNYMPILPYTGQAVADNWRVNVAMMELWKKRYRA